MVRWPGRAKWGVAPARTGRRAMPLGVSLSEGLGSTAAESIGLRGGAKIAMTLRQKRDVFE